MNFSEAIKSGFGKYATFIGRAARSEYWYWTLFTIVVSIATGIIDAMLFPGIASGLLSPLSSLALFLPSLAVSARRLHDLDRTAWWLLIALTGIGLILLLIWDCMKGTTGSNRFGADPLAA
jgi:uncharacterized membrane protein YhaH (DUF805 family)